MHLSTFAQVRVDGDKDVIGVYPASDYIPIQRSQWMQQANLLHQLGLQLLSLLWCHSNPGRPEINGHCRHDELGEQFRFRQAGPSAFNWRPETESPRPAHAALHWVGAVSDARSSHVISKLCGSAELKSKHRTQARRIAPPFSRTVTRKN